MLDWAVSVALCYDGSSEKLELIKQLWARLVLGWMTMTEVRVAEGAWRLNAALKLPSNDTWCYKV